MARKRCKGCGRIMPAHLPGGRMRRDDARYHSRSCRDRHVYRLAQIAEAVAAARAEVTA